MNRKDLLPLVKIAQDLDLEAEIGVEVGRERKVKDIVKLRTKNERNTKEDIPLPLLKVTLLPQMKTEKGEFLLLSSASRTIFSYFFLFKT
jgi:hypothetical protein